MFTADMARNSARATFDGDIAALVGNAYPNTSTYMKVWYEDDCGGSMEQQASIYKKSLELRGFKVTDITDIDSLRFAEVHFSWADDDSDDEV